MNDPKFWVSVLALALSCISLGWQAATYYLTGGRVKVRLLGGAASPNGMQRALGPVSTMTSNSRKLLADQGLVVPVFAVEVVNIGRQPVTVTRWGIEHVRGAQYKLTGYNEIVGPPLPYKLEAGGEPATWYVEGADLEAFTKAAEVLSWRWNWSAVRQRLGHRGKTTMRAAIELADGRKRRSKEAI